MTTTTDQHRHHPCPIPGSAIATAAAEGSDLNAYNSLSLLTGARTEELRALTGSDLDLIGAPTQQPPIPPTVQLWRSVRAHGSYDDQAVPDGPFAYPRVRPCPHHSFGWAAEAAAARRADLVGG